MIARCSLAVSGMILTLSSFSALADGTITGVTPSQSPGLACKLNTIKITGTGKCGTFLFQLGDPTPTVHLPGNFPIIVYHTYSNAGTYSLSAQGQGNCKGVVNASLQVVGPTITSIFAFSVTKPGGTVIIEGQNFGDLPGQILISFPSRQFATMPLENIQWGDTFAAGTIPAGISGVPDQMVNFIVVAQCGARSNPWTALFTAARDIAALPFDRITCWTPVGAGNSDQCQNWGQSNWPLECGNLPTFGTEPGPTGFQGYHGSGWGFSGESGNDGFWLSPTQTLNNGWVVDSVTGLSGTKVGNGSSATETWTSPPGATNPGVNVNWYSDNCGAILYYGDIRVSGPAGMPF